MATDNEQLVLSISADVRQIQRQLKSLVGQTERDTKAIEQAFGGIDKAASGAFNGVAANSNNAFKVGANGARQFERAMNSSRLQTANLAAQLNDIGVQLAGGQSPFLIALQQGAQINQVLGQGGARAAVGALAGAFTSLINPVSLATIAIISLGGTAVQYFTSLLSEGEKTEETLKRQAELIRGLAKEWGDTIPAIREYADELERAQKLANLREGAEIINADTLEATRASIAEVGVAVADVVSQLQAAGEETEIITGLQSAFNDFSEAAEQGSLTVEDVERVQDALAAAIASTGIPALADFKAMFDQLAASALNAAGSVQQLNAATGAATTGLYPSRGAYRGVERTSDGNIQNGGYMTPEQGPVPRSRPLIELEGLPKARGGGGRSKAISEAQREREAVAKLIEQLEFEHSLIGMTDQEREVANALRRAGAAATDEQRAKIEQLVEATYAEREALKANQEAMRELQAIGKEVLGGIVSDLRAGKSGADILANALDRVIDKLASSAIDSLFSGFGTGGRGGLLGGFLIPGILHSGGVAGRDGYGHGRSVSPGVFTGARRYHSGGVAGLQPGEVPAILQRGEVVLPRGTKMGKQWVHVTVGVSADNNGNLLPFVENVSDGAVQKAAPGILRVANSQVVPTMARHRDAKGGAEWRI
jgi:Prophage tail length tape measure protein.